MRRRPLVRPDDSTPCRPGRRQVMWIGMALASFPALSMASEPHLDLEWADLIPSGDDDALARLRDLGVVEHGQAGPQSAAPVSADLTREFDNKLVRIPGYIVPLEFKGTDVTSFLLVPFVGACIHVPAPPPNQLILVSTAKPYRSSGLFEPVYVTGIFGAAASETQLADVGYAISAEDIRPFEQ